MPEETDVATEEKGTEQETLNQDPSKEASAESETAEESSTEKTDNQDASGQDDKTAEGEETSEGSDDAGVKTGQPVPYKRFKQVLDNQNKFKTQVSEIKAELDEARKILSDPVVVKSVLQARGYKGQALADAMKEAGFDGVEESEDAEAELLQEFTKGLDLSKQESWLKVMAKMAKYFSGTAVKPIAEKLSEKDSAALVSQMETDAKKLAKDTYKIEYGTAGKDENNPATAVGKMWAYLQNHPEDAGLGHVKLLRLAMSEEGFKAGKEQGKKEERDRTKGLKSSQMEGDGHTGPDKQPDASWSTEDIIAWRRKHEKE